MTVSVVQTSTAVASVSTGTWSGTFGANVTAGSSIILAVDGYTGATFTGTAGSPKFNGSAVPGTSQLIPDTGNATCGGTIWLLPNVAGGATGYSVDVSGYGTNANTGIMALEVAGLGPSPSLDQVVVSTTSQTVTTGAVAFAPEFVLTLLVEDATFVSGPGAGWTAGPFVTANHNSATWYQVATSTSGTYSAVFSATASNYVVAVVSLYAPGAAPAPAPVPLLVPPGRRSPAAFRFLPPPPARGAPPPATHSATVALSGSGTLGATANGRSQYTWPFSYDSIWNLPVAATAAYAPTGITVTSDYSTDASAVEYCCTDPAQPVKSLTNAMLANGSIGAASVYVPPAMSAPGTWNDCAALLGTDNDTVYQGQTLSLTAGGNPSFGGDADVPSAVVSLKGTGITGAHGGSGLSALGGTLTVADLTGSGPIRHAMKLCFNGFLYYSSAGTGFQWPAVSADGGYNVPANVNYYGGSNPAIVLGALLALPPFTSPTKYSDPLVQKIAAAMQAYGAYLVDNTASGAGVSDSLIELNYDATSYFTGSGTFSSDFHTMLMDLRVVTNSASGTPGGGTIGASRFAAYAPPFNDGTGTSPALTVVTPQSVLTESQTDTFPGSLPDPQFSDYGTVTVSGDQALLSATTTESGIYANSASMLTGSHMLAKVTPYTGGTGPYTYFQAAAATGSGGAGIQYNSGNLYAYWVSSTGTVTNLTSITYSATAHAWWRIREDPATSTTYFDTAPDGVTWTNRWSVADPVNYSSMLAQVGSGISSGTAGNTAVADFNVVPVVPGAAALSGSGSLTAAGQKAAPGAAGLSGTGSLAGAGQKAAPGAAALAGAGTLGAAAAVTYAGTAGLSGSGSLASAEQKTVPGASALSGSGSLSAAGAKTVHAAAALSGSGSLAAAGQKTVPGASALSGSGTLTATGAKTVPGTAGLSGTGSLAASAAVTYAGTAGLSGTGALSGTETGTYAGTAGLSGSGSLTATGHKTAPGTAALSGTGSLGAAGAKTVPGGTALSGSGSLAAAGQKTVPGSAALSGSGSLAAAGFKVVPGAAALSGSGSLSATEAGTYAGTAALSGTGSLTASGAVSGQFPGAAGLSGSGTLAAQAAVTYAGLAALSGSGTMTAAGAKTVPGIAGLAGSGSLSAAGFKLVPGAAAISGTGALGATAAVSGSFSGTAALSGIGALAASPGVTVPGEVALAGSGLLGASPAVVVPGAAGLAGSGLLGASGAVTAFPFAALSGSGSLSASASGAIAAAAGLSGSGSMTAATSGPVIDEALLGGTIALTFPLYAGSVAATGTYGGALATAAAYGGTIE